MSLMRNLSGGSLTPGVSTNLEMNLNFNMSETSLNGYNLKMEAIISKLERGSAVVRFSYRKRPEKKTLLLRRETNQILWSRSTSSPRTSFDGAVDIREIKEIRLGKSSKDFDKWFEDSKKIESSKCFIIFYGNEFKLRTLSIAGNFFFLIMS